MPDVLASVGLNAAASLTGRSVGGICTRAKRLTHRGTAPGVDAVLEHWVVEASPLLSRKPLRRFAPSVQTRELHEGAGSTEDWIECQRRPTSAAAPVEGPSVSWLSDKNPTT